MSNLLDPKNDYVFKRLFADAPTLLAALIDAIRPQAAPIARLTVKDPTIDAEELRGKYIVLDLLAEDTDGAQYNIEMQVRRYRAWGARSAYYLAKLVTGQLVAGDDYGGLKPAIGIHLLDFDLFQDPAHREQAIWCFEMCDAVTPTVTLGQELQLNLIELRKADRLQRTTGALSAWIALFEHWQEDQTMSQIANEPVRAALDKLRHLSADAETRRLAFVRERALHDERSLLKDAREEGWEEGWEEGREEGREQGKADALRQIAMNLIRSSGLDDATIATATGLSLTDIGALRQQLQ